MAPKNQVLIFLLSLLIAMSSVIKPSHGGEIAVYWGQNSESGEGNLTVACDYDLYAIVALAYLHVAGSSISLNLDNHCPLGNCKALASQIEHCQSKGIKIFLSIEVDAVGDPDSLAEYLYENFLSGNESGPLGAVFLDGIDLAHVEQSLEKWEKLVKAINGSTTERKIYISGAPLCSAISSLDNATHTGLFDYLWVSYYGSWAPCEYLGNDDFTGLLQSWELWLSKPGLANTRVMLGLVASNDTAAASNGYISPDLLKSKVLPIVNVSSNYGGVMLWNRYWDEQTGYSGEIKGALGTKVRQYISQVAVSRKLKSILSKSVYYDMYYSHVIDLFMLDYYHVIDLALNKHPL